MRYTALLPVLVLCLALAAPAQAAESLDSMQLTGQQTQTTPSLMPALEAQSTLPLQANAPVYMDQVLAREHQRFTEFAIDQMHKMNANILGGRHSMQVHKQGNGLYRASYRAIDVAGIVCQVRRSESNPNYFVGSVLYTEQILESVAQAPEACRKGEFQRVSEKQNRIIYSSKNGGGWQ